MSAVSAVSALAPLQLDLLSWRPPPAPPALVAVPAPAPLPTDCAWCGTELDEISDFGTYWLLDVLRTPGEADVFARFAPCCDDMGWAVATEGYEAAVGRTAADVIAELTGEDVLDVSEDGEGSVVCRLGVRMPLVVDPAELVAAKAAGRLASCGSGVAGWQREVMAEVTARHRHNGAHQGWKFGLEVTNGSERVAVATVGRPGSRVLAAAEPLTLEVARVCAWGHPALRANSSSAAYAAAAKGARALGADKLVTYTLADEESGASLWAAGWLPVRWSAGGSRSRPSRERGRDERCEGPKLRWERGLSGRQRKAVRRAAQAFLASWSDAEPEAVPRALRGRLGRLGS